MTEHRPISAAAIVAPYLDRIAARDGTIKAFAAFDREAVLAEARALDPNDRGGLLYGQPIAVKDVIDASGWPTRCNSPICDDTPAAEDAAVVARLKAAGAVVAGKAVTTEFAFTEPGPTVNPHDITRTPGGSSSGSAAAVADRQAFAALTTQTGGSTIRPASYCGIFGYKGPFGRVPTHGLRLLAPSFDVIGAHAGRLEDLALVTAVMEARPKTVKPAGTPAFVHLLMPEIDDAEAYALDAVTAAANTLRAAGAEVRPLILPAIYTEVSAAHRVVMSWEMSRTFASDIDRHPDLLSDSIRGFIELGQSQSDHGVAAARATLANWRADLAGLVRRGEILIMPSTTSEAPVGIASTGSASMNRVWTALGLGALTMPWGSGPAGLPLGLQLIDPDPGSDFLFPAAAWAADALGIRAVPLPEGA